MIHVEGSGAGLHTGAHGGPRAAQVQAAAITHRHVLTTHRAPVSPTVQVITFWTCMQCLLKCSVV